MEPLIGVGVDHVEGGSAQPEVVPRDVGFTDLFAERRVQMVRLAFLLTGSLSYAEEVAQEAFARVYERWATIEMPAQFLRATVVNRCHSWHRHQAVAARKVHLIGDGEAHVDYPNELADALAKLPPRRRAAVVLRYYEHLTVAEIALLLGISEGTVKSSLHRALDQLKGMLA
jgi:RNA polymerase sigma factor (sigma-70 family)